MAGQFDGISNPQNFPVRPVIGGMVLNRPTQDLQPNECVNAEGYIISEKGPKRAPAFRPYASKPSYAVTGRLPYRYIDMFTLWTTGQGELAQQLMLITDGPLFRVGLGGFEEVEWLYTTGTVTVSGNVVTGVGTAWDDATIFAGDIFRIGTLETRIETIVSNTEIELEESVFTDGAYASYSIARAFNDIIDYLCDWAVVDSEIVFADLNKPLQVYKYDAPEGSQHELYIQETTHKINNGYGYEDVVARCLTVFQERLFVGYTIEATDGVRRHRVRWSKVTNKRDFSETTAYLDLPYTQGSLKRLVPLGNTLIAYFDDAIFLGLPTNNPKLPVAFQKIDTGGQGLIGMKAVTPFIGGHFFVGQDDIYFMSTSGPEPIGTKVVQQTVRATQKRARVYASLDIENDCVVFGFPGTEDNIERLWYFNYKTKAWSNRPFDSYMIANPIANFELSWEDLVGFTWADIGDTYLTWDSMSDEEAIQPFFIEHLGAALRTDNEGEVDTIINLSGEVENLPINTVYETGDIDLGSPDDVKTFIRLGIKIDFSYMPETPTTFVLQGSVSRGRTWQALGNLTIAVGDDEGYATFLLTSSHARFRLSAANEIPPYTITEFVYKIRKRSSELTPGLQGV